MNQNTICDDFIDFIQEFTELLKQDWEKTKTFVKENTKYVYWVIILFVTMQFTDIISIGKSYERFCKTNSMQRGGANAGPAPADTGANAKAGAANAKAGAAGANAKAGAAGADAKAGAAGADGAATGAATGAAAPALPGAKQPKLKKSVFGKTKRGIASSIKNNPVFGNLDKIFGYVESIAVIITFILIVIGILSLPILLFISVTYVIIKKVLKYFLFL